MPLTSEVIQHIVKIKSSPKNLWFKGTPKKSKEPMWHISSWKSLVLGLSKVWFGLVWFLVCQRTQVPKKVLWGTLQLTLWEDHERFCGEQWGSSYTILVFKELLGLLKRLGDSTMIQLEVREETFSFFYSAQSLSWVSYYLNKSSFSDLIQFSPSRFSQPYHHPCLKTLSIKNKFNTPYQ